MTIPTQLNNLAPRIRGSCLFYGAAILPVLRQKTREEIVIIADDICKLNEEKPFVGSLGDDPLPLPSLDGQLPQVNGKSGKYGRTQLVTVLVMCMWLLLDENPELGKDLMAVWPIKEILSICPKT